MTTEYRYGSLYGFEPDKPIHVVVSNGPGWRNIECLTYKSEDDGIRVTYRHSAANATFRAFIPTHAILEIFQVVEDDSE